MQAGNFASRSEAIPASFFSCKGASSKAYMRTA